MRRPDWLEQLWRTLEAAERKPFAWGSHDCVRLSASVVDAITDSDWLAHVATLYSNEEEGRALIANTEGGLKGLVSARLGDPVPRNLARRGDVVLCDLPTGPAIGICTGEAFATAATPVGISYLSLERAICAWRVD